MNAMWERGDLAHHLAGTGERAAQLLGDVRIITHCCRNRKKLERAVGASDGKPSIGEFDIGFGGFEPICGNAAAFLDDFAGCAVCGNAGQP